MLGFHRFVLLWACCLCDGSANLLPNTDLEWYNYGTALCIILCNLITITQELIVAVDHSKVKKDVEMPQFTASMNLKQWSSMVSKQECSWSNSSVILTCGSDCTNTCHYTEFPICGKSTLPFLSNYGPPSSPPPLILLSWLWQWLLTANFALAPCDGRSLLRGLSFYCKVNWRLLAPPNYDRKLHQYQWSLLRGILWSKQCPFDNRLYHGTLNTLTIRILSCWRRHFVFWGWVLRSHEYAMH